MLPVPSVLRTSRLILRAWRAEDAETLHPILEANRAHLGPWIPARISDPASVPLLRERLSGFSADFSAGREWRFAIFEPDASRLLGEIGLYPRNASRRVPFTEADRVELGYWLRADVTGRGLATEAAQAALDVAIALPRFSEAEIRCDARNAPSAAIPRRLGFALATTIEQPSVVPDAPPVALQVWTLPLEPRRR